MILPPADVCALVTTTSTPIGAYIPTSSAGSARSALVSASSASMRAS